MNDLFVNVKVDREERPDVDAIYMDAVQAMTGQGGWPMTVFLTPDGRPFYGGTYFPKPSASSSCSAASTTPGAPAATSSTSSAGQLVESLRPDGPARAAAAEPPGVAALNTAPAAARLARSTSSGAGSAGRPSSPRPMSLELLLRAARRTAPATARCSVVTTTLDAMASGGIYDHLGGGFARYSVDELWLVPHFEKMLYDQALLARVYLHAWQVTGERPLPPGARRDDRLRARATCATPRAGSSRPRTPTREGEEGRFYVWTPARSTPRSAPELAPAAHRVVRRHRGRQLRGPQHPHPPGAGRPGATAGGRGGPRRAVRRARAERVRPGLDDKVLTEWNALMLATLAEAARRHRRRADWLDAAARQRRVPARPTCAAPTAAGCARGRPTAAPATLALRRPTTPRSSTPSSPLAEATGEARWIDEARAMADALLDLLLGRRQRRRVHHRRRRRGARRPPEGPARQRHAVGQLDGRRRACSASPRSPASSATGTTPSRSCSWSAGSLAGAPDGLRPPARRGRHAAGPGVTEIAVVGDRPDLVAAVRARYLPNAVLAWGEPYESPLWQDRTPGSPTCAATTPARCRRTRPRSWPVSSRADHVGSDDAQERSEGRGHAGPDRSGGARGGRLR